MVGGGEYLEGESQRGAPFCGCHIANLCVLGRLVAKSNWCRQLKILSKASADSESKCNFSSVN